MGVRAVVGGGAGGALAPLEFRSLTLFQPEGADYVHHITASTPGFENLTTSLASMNYFSPTGNSNIELTLMVVSL